MTEFVIGSFCLFLGLVGFFSIKSIIKSFTKPEDSYNPDDEFQSIQDYKEN